MLPSYVGGRRKTVERKKKGVGPLDADQTKEGKVIGKKRISADCEIITFSRLHYQRVIWYDSKDG